MGGVSWSVFNKLKEKSDNQQKEIDDLSRKNEELNIRYKERQEEIQRQEEKRNKEAQEELKRRTTAFEILDNNLKLKQEEEIALIEKEFEEYSSTWCEQEIKDFDFSKILKDYYPQLIKSEALDKIFIENIKNLLKEKIKQNEVNHLNIQIIGKTGVGKSTLVNSLLSKEVAIVSVGEPCTMETKCYQNEEKYPFLRIYDTRGVEISQNFNIDALFESTFKDIIEKCEKNEPDDLIHCLFYCFTGSRFEKNEAEILIKLRKAYEGNKLPIIIVYTQYKGNEKNKKLLIKAINDILYEKIDEQLSDVRKGISFIPILAEGEEIYGQMIPPTGLDLLMKNCLEKAEYSCHYACNSAIKLSAEKKLKKDFEKIKNEILKGRERILETLFEKKGLEEKIFEDIIEKIFMPFTLNNIRQHVNHETFVIIKEINKKIIEIILEKEEKKFRNYFEEKVKNIAKELSDSQTKVGKTYSNISFGDHLKDSDEFEYKINGIVKSKFNQKSKIYAIRNTAKILSITITDVFMECFINDYLKVFESDEIKKFLESITSNCFSKELKEKVEGLIADLKQNMGKVTN